MNRTFTTASVVSLPTRRTTPSWMTRSSFAWMDFGISISSSRNSVPPLAVSSSPGLSRAAPDQDLQLRAGERLRQVIPRPRLERLEARGDRRVPRHDDDDRARISGERGLQQLAARDLAHEPVDEGNVEGTPLQRVAGLVATPGHDDVVAFRLEYAVAAFPQRALVIHDQNADTRSGGRIDRRQRWHTPSREGSEGAVHRVVVCRRRITRSSTSKVWH